MHSFLGTEAPFSADLNLILQVLMGLTLLMGFVLARWHHYRAHKYVQSSVVLFNLVLIGWIMIPHFHQQVQDEVAAHLDSRYYAVSAAHAALGFITELLALYVVLVAGTSLIPRRLRFTRFKPWMRTTLALWWLAILMGVATYYVWYISPPTASTASLRNATGNVNLVASDFKFTPRTVTITAGTAITWFDSQGTHRIRADKGSFRSNVLTTSDRYSFRLTKPGVYRYYCEFHGGPNGVGMSGVIVVKPKH